MSLSSQTDLPGNSEGAAFDFSLPPSAPPPPPIPSFDWGGKSQMTPLDSAGVFTEPFATKSSGKGVQTPCTKTGTLYGTDKSFLTTTATELRSSQLVKQRTQLRPAAAGPHPCEKVPDASLKAGPRSSIRASQLEQQRLRLLPTHQPHPNQLSDLSLLPDNRLSDLANVLRKVNIFYIWCSIYFPPDLEVCKQKYSI